MPVVDSCLNLHEIADCADNSLSIRVSGVTDMTIETILVKFTAIGVYASEDIKGHLKAWGGKASSDLTAEESGYFKDFVDGARVSSSDTFLFWETLAL